MISGRCRTRYDIAEGSPDLALAGLKRRTWEKMIWASLRASNGSNRILLASSYRMSSWMIHETSWCTCSGLQSTSVGTSQTIDQCWKDSDGPGVPWTMSFMEAICLATSSSTFALTVGSHNLCKSSFRDFAISVGCFCRRFPPNRNAMAGIAARSAEDAVASYLFAKQPMNCI